MKFKKVKDFFFNTGDGEFESVEDEFYENIDDDEANAKTMDAFKSLAGNGQQMVLTEPRAYSESQQIADHLKARKAIVINLKRVTAEQAKRIIDFISGVIYAIGGDIQKVGGGIFLCTPKNVNVSGEISDDEEDQITEEI